MFHVRSPFGMRGIQAMNGATALRAERLLGAKWKRLPSRVLVTSQHFAAGLAQTIRVGPHSPISDDDAFVLGLCRARADGVLLTGKILRDEPYLSTVLSPDLIKLRSEMIGCSSLAKNFILTSRWSDDYLKHPLVSNPSLESVFLIQDPHFDGALSKKFKPSKNCSVFTVNGPLTNLLETIANRFKVRNLSIEAGPSTVSQMRSCIQAIVLSQFSGNIDRRAIGSPPAFDLEAINETFECVHSVRIGEWSFSVYMLPTKIENEYH